MLVGQRQRHRRDRLVDLPVLRFNRSRNDKKYSSYVSKLPFSNPREEFLGAGANSSYMNKLVTYIRPDFLRISAKKGTPMNLHGDQLEDSEVQGLYGLVSEER